MSSNQTTTLFLIGVLGFSSGLPLLLTSSTLQAWYTQEGLNLVAIGALSLVGLPYLLKFLWAPLFDLFPLPFLGPRKGWLIVLQILLLLSILWLSLAQPLKFPFLAASIALAVSIISASQDVVINAVQTEAVTKENLGLSAASYVTGYRLAMIVSGGLALILAERWNFHIVYQLMALTIIPGIVATFLLKDGDFSNQKNADFNLRQLILPFSDLFQRKHVIVFLLFITLFKISYSLSLIMTPTFLLRGVNFSLTEVGAVNKGIGIFMTIIGVFCGGLFIKFFSMKSGLLFSGFSEAFCNVFYALLAVIGKSLFLMFFCVSFENFFAGMESVIFLGFLMENCKKPYTATQFALLSGFSSMPRILLGPFAGWLAKTLGWFNFYILIFLIFIPMALLIFWKFDAFLTPLATDDKF